MKALKLNNRTKINFGKVNEPAGVILPPAFNNDDLFQFNLSMLDRFDHKKILFPIEKVAQTILGLKN